MTIQLRLLLLKLLKVSSYIKPAQQLWCICSIPWLVLINVTESLTHLSVQVLHAWSKGVCNIFRIPLYIPIVTTYILLYTYVAVDRWLSETTDFMSESTIMAYFDHPNVLSMVGLCVDVDFYSIDIVLPFMSNGDLRAFLKSQRVEQGNVSTFPEVQWLLN